MTTFDHSQHRDASRPSLARRFASLVKLEHTVFALPFALASAVLASRYATLTWTKLALIVLCVAAARTAAMAFNRLVDRAYDAHNPRTKDREIPAGLVGVAQTRLLVLASSAVFVAGAWALGYSYTKRFTALCHVVLGAAIAFAPGGAWIATGAPVTLAPWLLVLGVACWVAGFDVLYALSDREFDAQAGLRSIPVALGVKGTLVLSALLHVVTLSCLVAVGMLLHRHVLYFTGTAIVAALLAYEHAIVRPSDLSKLGKAFFDLNGWVSLAFFLCVLADRFLS